MSASDFQSGRERQLDCTWIMFQKWRYLLFMSWPIPLEELRKHVPPSIEIDTFDGTAWISMLPMKMEGLHLRLFPPVLTTSTFAEINFRTYVTVNGQRAVYFLSIDAGTCIGAFVARQFFKMPYLYAKSSIRRDGSTFRLASHRRESRFAKAASFAASYTPIGDPAPPPKDSLTHFLVSRYAEVAMTVPGKIFTGQIDHAPWQVTGVEAHVEVNTIPEALGLDFSGVTPEFHFSWGTDVRLCGVSRLKR